MHKSIAEAMKEQIEARHALLALDPERPKEEFQAAETRMLQADKDVVAAFEKASDETDKRAEEWRDKVSLARYLGAIKEQKTVDGAEAELRTELGLSDMAIPLEALLPLSVEERTDAVSPQDTASKALAFGTINQTRANLLTRLFKQTDTAFLGVAMPSVPAGERVYPVMTDGTTAGMVERGDEAPDAKAAKFGVVNATPKRLSARYVFDLEGVATLGAELESTLRADLRRAMGYQMDLQILNGDNADGEVNGLINQLPLTASPADTYASNQPNKVVDWSIARQTLTLLLDGVYARSEAAWRILWGQATYNILRNSYRTAQAQDVDGVAAVAGLGAAQALSFQIAAPATATVTGQSGASTKKLQAALFNSEAGFAVAPIWQGITMIRDPYSEASKAQVVMTAHMMFDFILRRTGGWKKIAFRTET